MNDRIRFFLGVLVVGLVYFGGYYHGRMQGWNPGGSPSPAMQNDTKTAESASEAASPPTPADVRSPEPLLRVDPNEADARRLAELPGIGPKLAERILLDRRENGRYVRAEDLLRVRGIGPKLLEKIRKNLILPQ